MQITPLSPGSLGLDRTRSADGVAATQRLADAPAAAPATPAAAAAPMHAGLRVLDTQRNGRVASAQQAQAWLEQLTPRLRNLQTDLGRVVAGQPVPAERLEAQRARIEQLWNARSSVAGGELDAQLDYRPGTPARRGFTVRGLETAPQAREALFVALGLPSAARPGVRVVLDPEATPQSQARAFDQALRPLGLQAAAGDAGGLRFAVAEERWPQVRDGLAVRGEGRQYAAGRLHRVAADPEPDLLTPQRWALGDSAGAQTALQQIDRALPRAEAARTATLGVLLRDRAALADAPAAQDAAWAARFGQEFAAGVAGATSGRENRYGMVAVLGAALGGLGRERVERLLDPV